MLAPAFLNEGNLEAEESFLFDKIRKSPAPTKVKAFSGILCFEGFCYSSGAESFFVLSAIGDFLGAVVAVFLCEGALFACWCSIGSLRFIVVSL